MLNDEGWRYLLPEQVRSFPVDLWLVVVAVVAAWAVALVSETGNPVSGGVAAVFVLFVPGYALVAAMFPATRSRSDGRFLESRVEVDLPERLALSVGLSIVVSPFVGLLLSYTPVGARPVPLVVAIGGISLLLAITAAVRRESVPPEDRFAIGDAVERFSPAGTPARGHRVAIVAVVLAILVAIGTVGYIGANPRTGEEFSELYLLSANEDGSLAADDYPEDLVRGGSASLTVGIENHEGEQVHYTVVVALQRLDGGQVVEEEELRRFRADLASGETWRLNHAVEPTMTGENLRLTYLLYRGEAPQAPSIETADEEVHVWIDVTDPTA